MKNSPLAALGLLFWLGLAPAFALEPIDTVVNRVEAARLDPQAWKAYRDLAEQLSSHYYYLNKDALALQVGPYDRSSASWTLTVESSDKAIPFHANLSLSLFFEVNLGKKYQDLNALFHSSSFSYRIPYQISSVGDGTYRVKLIQLELGVQKDGRFQVSRIVTLPNDNTARWLFRPGQRTSPLRDSVVEYVASAGGEYWQPFSLTYQDGTKLQNLVSEFQVAVYPVTQALFQQVTGKSPSFWEMSLEAPLEDFGFQYPDLVSLADLALFCNTLSQRDGLEPYYTVTGTEVKENPGASGWRTFRGLELGLLESQETKDRSVISWGADSANLVNPASAIDARPQPVGLKKPDSFGIYDLYGMNASLRLARSTSGTKPVTETDPDKLLSMVSKLKAGTSEYRAALAALVNTPFEITGKNVATKVVEVGEAGDGGPLARLSIKSLDVGVPFDLTGGFYFRYGINYDQYTELAAAIAKGKYQVSIGYRISQVRPGVFQTTLTGVTIRPEVSSRLDWTVGRMAIDSRAVGMVGYFDGTQRTKVRAELDPPAPAPPKAESAPAPKAEVAPPPKVEAKVEAPAPVKPQAPGPIEAYGLRADQVVMQYADGNWTPTTMSSTALALDNNGVLWGINGNYELSRLDTPTKVERGGVADVVFGKNGNTYIVTLDGKIEVKDGAGWKGLKSPFVTYHLSAAPDGTLWAIGDEKFLYHFVGGQWTKLDGEAATVVADANGSIWATNKQGFIFRFDGTSVTMVPGNAVRIFTGAHGEVWALGPGFNTNGANILRWTGTGWKDVAGGATSLAVR